MIKVINDVLTKEECEDMIIKINNSKLRLVETDDAKYHRHQEENDELAKLLFTRMGTSLGVNPNIRYSKYDPGMEFKKHTDKVNQDKHGRRSVMTVCIYLNDDFEGGETCFYDNDRITHVVVPKTGKACIFDHNLTHCGNKVINGNKYLLRTDLMTQ